MEKAVTDVDVKLDDFNEIEHPSVHIQGLSGSWPYQMDKVMVAYVQPLLFTLVSDMSRGNQNISLLRWRSSFNAIKRKLI